MAKRAEKKVPVVEYGSDNVFADLGLPDADELLAKAKLMHAIQLAMKESNIKQVELAKRTGIAQPKLSELINGRISGFSSDRLMYILTKLGQDVDIYIHPKPYNEPRDAQVSVAMMHRI